MQIDNNTGRICIVIPVYKLFSKLETSEVISWRQCLNVLSSYAIYLACPKGFNSTGYISELQEKYIEFYIEEFPPSSFVNIDGYNKLMLTKRFFNRFAKYEYMLTYQLDAFIFKDDLVYWCNLKYAYIGAPWFVGGEPQATGSNLWRVGNGGFTLRRIPDCLRVFNTFSVVWPWDKLSKWYFRYGRKRGLKKVPTLIKSLMLGNNTYWLLNDFHKLREQFQEDYFWGVVCNDKFDWYKVPTPEQALKFSFEVAPRVMFELNNCQLPTGCHAWDLYDPDFWEQYIPSNSLL